MNQQPNNVTYNSPQPSYVDATIYNTQYQPNTYVQSPPPTTITYQVPIPIESKEQYIQPATCVKSSPIPVGQVVYSSPPQNQPPAQIQYQQPQQFIQQPQQFMQQPQQYTQPIQIIQQPPNQQYIQQPPNQQFIQPISTQEQQFNQTIPSQEQQFTSILPQDQPVIYSPLQKVDRYNGEFATNRITIIN